MAAVGVFGCEFARPAIEHALSLAHVGDADWFDHSCRIPSSWVESQHGLLIVEGDSAHAIALPASHPTFAVRPSLLRVFPVAPPAPAPRQWDLGLTAYPPWSPNCLAEQIQCSLELFELRRRLEGAARFAIVGKVTAGVLHELKNPLNNLIGGVERLLHCVPDEQQGKIQPWKRIIARNADLLRESVSEFLSAFRDHGSGSPVHLVGLLDRAIEYVFKGEVGAANIEVRQTFHLSDPLVEGNPGTLLHLFLNLLVNCRQELMTAGGWIELETRPGPELDGSGPPQLSVCVAIRDSGRGFPQQVLDHFPHRVATTKSGGSGLGLLLCHEIVRAHNGRLRLANHAAGGAHIEIDLPLAVDSV